MKRNEYSKLEQTMLGDISWNLYRESECDIKNKPFVSKFITNFVFKLRGMGWQNTY